MNRSHRQEQLFWTNAENLQRLHEFKQSQSAAYIRANAIKNQTTQQNKRGFINAILSFFK